MVACFVGFYGSVSFPHWIIFFLCFCSIVIKFDPTVSSYSLIWVPIPEGRLVGQFESSQGTDCFSPSDNLAVPSLSSLMSQSGGKPFRFGYSPTGPQHVLANICWLFGVLLFWSLSNITSLLLDSMQFLRQLAVFPHLSMYWRIYGGAISSHSFVVYTTRVVMTLLSGYFAHFFMWEFKTESMPGILN